MIDLDLRVEDGAALGVFTSLVEARERRQRWLSTRVSVCWLPSSFLLPL